MIVLQTIETASWVETHTRWGQPVGDHCVSSRHWLRVSPPAEAHYIDFGDSWSHDVTDERGHLATGSSWKICQLYPHRQPYDASWLHRRVIFVPPEQDGTQVRPGCIWKHAEVELEGRAVNHYSREFIEDIFRVTETVWTELQTDRIVRKECRQTDPQTTRLIAVESCDNYAYNVVPPAGIFEMPPGKPVVTPDLDATLPEVWNTLPDRDKLAIQAIINRSDAAWCSCDVPAFEPVWEFDFDSLVPRKVEWLQRLEEQKGLWTHWSSVVQSVHLNKPLFVTVARNCYKWSPERRKVLHVRVKLHVAWNQGANEWTGDAEFYLRRKGRGYRIVHWHCPWERIREELGAEQ